MAYMFTDIRHGLSPMKVEAYSIVRPKIGTEAEAIEYARSILQDKSTLINWSDKEQQTQFLKARRTVAESLVAK